MISIARTFGAPETVPAGKQATSASSRSCDRLAACRHDRDEVHDVRVALERHVGRHPHRAVLGDAADVVAAEVDEHDVLGALLLVRFSSSASRTSSSSFRPRGRVPAIGCVSMLTPSTRTSISGEEPTIERPPTRRKYMYGDGFTCRSAR